VQDAQAQLERNHGGDTQSQDVYNKRQGRCSTEVLKPVEFSAATSDSPVPQAR